MSDKRHDLTQAENLFKIKYEKLARNVYNSKTPLLARIKKSYNFVGKQKFVPVPMGFGGGVGSGSLPKSNVKSIEDALITSKKIYAVCQVDREAIKAAQNDEGAFVRMTKFPVQSAVESFSRNCERFLHGDGTGALAAGDNTTNVSGDGSTGTPYLVTLASDTIEANIEEKDYWNYDSETSILEVVAYNPTTKVVSLVGTSTGLAALTGSGPVPNTKFFYMQGSKDNDPQGLTGCLGATSGSKYNIPIQRRWQSHQLNANNLGFTTDMLNEVVLEIKRKSGLSPNHIEMSYKQYRKFKNQLEDKKYITVMARDKAVKGRVGFKALAFDSDDGEIPVFPNRFVADDRVNLLNVDHLEFHHRPGGPEWFDEDGTIFMRVAGEDAYEARYGMYGEFVVALPFQGEITGLA